MVKACDRKSYEDGLGAESLSKKFLLEDYGSNRYIE